MDYEEAGNLTEHEDVTPEASSRFIAHEIVFCLICLFAIIADLFIIFVIFRFKRMHTAANIFLANWAIADLCCLFVTPSAYRIISIISHRFISAKFMCFLLQTGVTLHIMTLWFAMLVALDWCLAAYFEKASEKFRNHYRYVLAIMWTLALIGGTVSIGLCSSSYIHFFYVCVLFFSYCALLLFVIVLQISRAIQKCRRKLMVHPSLMLTLVSSFVLSWFLGFMSFLCMVYTGLFHIALGVAATCAIFCSSVVTLILLYNLNKDFQGCFLQVLRRSSNKYEEADFDFVNPLVNSSFRKPIVKFSFHKDPELAVN